MSKGIDRLKVAIIGSKANAAPTKQNSERRGVLEGYAIERGLYQKGVDAGLLSRRPGILASSVLRDR